MITKKEVMDMANEYSNKIYPKRNANFDLDDKFYELKFLADLKLPEQVKQYGVVLPTARDLVDAGANYLSTSYCKFYRPLRGDDDKSHKQAEMLRQFDMAMFYRTKSDSTISPWRTANKHAFMHGMWVWETLYDPEAIPDPPKREENETEYDFAKRVMIYDGERHDRLPIIIRSRHPKSVFPEPGTDNPSHAIVKDQVSVASVKADYPNWVTTRENQDKVPRVIWYDERHYGVFVDNESVLSSDFVEHYYGFMPLVIGYSGIGNMDVDANPETKAVGLIRYLFDALVAESFAFSVYYIVMRSHAWPVKFASGPGAKAVANMEFEYGKIHELPVGTKVEDMISAPPSETLMEALAYINGVLASSAAPRSIRGLPETGVRSSVDRSMIMQQASLKYEGVKEQMQIGTAKVMSNCTKLAERVVPEDFHLWAHTPDADIDLKMEKSEIKHHYNTYAEFSPTSPEEDSRRHADMMNLTKTGMISADTGRRRYLSHLDPDREAIKVEAERLRVSPVVQQIMGQIIGQELAGEIQRLNKIRQLKMGGTIEAPATQPGLPSGEGLEQQLGVGMRQVAGISNPPLTPGEQTEQMVNQRGFLTQKQGGLPQPGKM